MIHLFYGKLIKVISSINSQNAETVLSQDNHLNNLFLRAPEYFVIQTDEALFPFLHKTNLLINSQQHHEITRQCFDAVCFDFEKYVNDTKDLPRLNMLTDSEKYYDSVGNLNNTYLNLRIATREYSLALYFIFFNNGLFIEGETAYILENVKDNYCVLLNTAYRNK